MKPDPWCCICESYVADTVEQVRAKELVAHETCYLRAKKFFDSLDRIGRSSETHQCEVVLGADLMDGHIFCGKPVDPAVYIGLAMSMSKRRSRKVEFMFGAELCGQPATKQVDCGYSCMHWVCDEHVQAQK